MHCGWSDRLMCGKAWISCDKVPWRCQVYIALNITAFSGDASQTGIAWQNPSLQLVPGGQMFPHLPQFRESYPRSLHSPLQMVMFPWHTHAPPKQSVPVGQRLPHSPQFSGSALVSMQLPLQETRLSGHEHFPLVQTWSSGQTFPHVPQLIRS